MQTKTLLRTGTRRSTACAGALIASTLASAALAGTKHVPAEYRTIQAAIDASIDGDEIVLADGTYTGAGNKNLAFAGRGVTLQSANGPAACTIDVQGAGVIFDLTAADGADLQIEGITITDSGFEGLGLRCNGASPVVVDCVFEGFYMGAFGGGAVDVAGGAPVFRHCTFRDNLREGECGAAGGAIFAGGGTLRMEDCHFEENVAGGSSCVGLGFGWGGAIFLGDNATLEAVRTTFAANRADSPGAGHGGAVFVQGTASFANCEFRDNVAFDYDTLTFEVSGAGGAVFVDGFEGAGGLATFVNCLMVGNESFGIGGAVLSRGTSEFFNCTIADNADRPGSGAIHTTADTTTTVRNSIVRSIQTNAIVGPGAVDVAYSNVKGGGAAGSGTIDVDPGFTDAANGDYRLAAGSPSIDTGDAALLPADDLDLDDDGDVAEPLPVDIRDFARVIAADVDMGAYETTCAADFDGDGGVGFTDLTSLLGAWGPCPGCPQDLDGDDLVGFTDLTALLPAWGPC